MVRKGPLTVCDFFSGAGGFSEGFRQKGFKLVMVLDNWKPAIETHELNHPECKAYHMDILELDTPEKIDQIVPDTDIIVGSPPCVSFSGSNKAGKADKSLGIRLIEAYLRIILWKLNKGKLKYWILENVPNSGKYIKEKYTWKELGLPGKGPDLKIPKRGILNAAYYGAPQGRKRFVCGSYPMPEKSHNESNWITTKKVMEELGNPLDDKRSETIKDPVHKFTINSTKLTDHYYDSRVPEYEWKKAKRLKVDHGFMGKMDFPENLNRPSRTVMATLSSSTREAMIFDAKKNGKHVGFRAPTIREVASFMGFPINYQFSGNNEGTKYKQVGNAVCIPLSAALAEAILKAEKMEIPKYIKLHKIEVPVNLNGTKKIFKKPKMKREDAKFAVHIPYLKARGFRVELSNKDSKFNKGEIIWKCYLHYGSGKGAKMREVSQSTVDKWLRGDHNDKEFKKEAISLFKKTKLTHKKLQENYVMNDESHGLNPEKALEMMKELIDKHYPENEYKNNIVEESSINNIVGRKFILRRILAGLFVCNEFVSKLT